MSFLRVKQPWVSYEVHSLRDADIILCKKPEIFSDIENWLSKVYFTKEDVLRGGGGQSTIVKRIGIPNTDWNAEKAYLLEYEYEDRKEVITTHKVDAVKSRVAVEIEWNTHSEFFDRDLANFSRLYSRDIIDLGIILTRSSSLHRLFRHWEDTDGLSKGKFGSTHTHMDQLRGKLISGGGGNCPVLAIAITEFHLRYVPDSTHEIFRFD